jgi:4-hydroxybenzoate polyprenyltransferase
MNRLRDYAMLMRLDKPIGALLLLWPTLWALWIAGNGQPQVLTVVVFVAGVMVMRSAGCVINDIADRDIDLHVERTQNRPLTAGRVTTREALALFGVLTVAAFGLVLLMNPFTIALSVAGIALAATYPLMKRVTYLPQAYLGVAFGWGIPMAFAAEQNAVPLAGWFLLATNIIWAIAYDTMYAMADREDDLRIGVKSSAILFGRADRLIVGILQLTTLGMLASLALVLAMGPLFWAGLGVAACTSIYQQYLIRERDRGACFQAFLNNNWFGGAVFVGLVADYHLAHLL